MDFTPEETKRYARHLTLPQVGEEGQRKLKNSKVLLIGAGGLGSPIALYLAAAGVGQIAIIDDDRVGLENLQRQILYKTNDVDWQKVDIAKGQLAELNPDVKVSALACRFDSQNAMELVSNCDIVIDGSDNFDTRYLANEACVLAKKPLVFGAIFRFDGQLSVFNYEGGPCYACLYPEPPMAEDVPNCSEAGVLGVLPGVIGTLMATETLKLILGFDNILSFKLLTYSALETHFQTLKISKREDCHVCGKNGIKKLSQPKLNSEIDSSSLRKILENSRPHLIDVRSFEEFSASHLPNAIHIPLNQIASSIGRIPSDEPVIFICQSGVRSTRALEIMRSLGRINGSHLTGGLNDFEKVQ